MTVTKQNKTTCIGGVCMVFNQVLDIMSEEWGIRSTPPSKTDFAKV